MKIGLSVCSFHTPRISGGRCFRFHSTPKRRHVEAVAMEPERIPRSTAKVHHRWKKRCERQRQGGCRYPLVSSNMASWKISKKWLPFSHWIWNYPLVPTSRVSHAVTAWGASSYWADGLRAKSAWPPSSLAPQPEYLDLFGVSINGGSQIAGWFRRENQNSLSCVCEMQGPMIHINSLSTSCKML